MNFGENFLNLSHAKYVKNNPIFAPYIKNKLTL